MRQQVRFCRIFDEINAALKDNKDVTNQHAGLRVAGLIFVLISIAHIARVAIGLEIRIGGQTVPMWPSTIAAVLFGVLGVWLWRLPGRDKQL